MLNLSNRLLFVRYQDTGPRCSAVAEKVRHACVQSLVKAKFHYAIQVADLVADL